MSQLSINSKEFSHPKHTAVVIHMISLPHFLMSVHCCEIDADHYYYLIMTSQNAFVSTYAVE